MPRYAASAIIGVMIPQFYRLHQSFHQSFIDDVPSAVLKELRSLEISGRVRPGQSVAVAVASRGTHDIRDLVLTVLDFLKDLELKPYIVPAMGSHGGGTAEGQARVIRDLGLGEEDTGIPIVSSMEVVSFGTIAEGPEVFFSADALKADHLAVINRVKPHTVFRGEVESGLCKMLAVGCGKQKGAANMHRYDLSRTIVPSARRIMEHVPVLFGVAVTETADGKTHSVKAALPEGFVDTDSALLKTAYDLLPRIPTDNLDLLIVDEMGKNISGPGMDTNVTGMWRRDGGVKDPHYRYLVVLDVTEASHGNATGIGMADITTRRVYDKIDWKATYLNALTAVTPRNGACPILAENDREAVDMALAMLPENRPLRIARIKNTLELTSLWATAPVRDELTALSHIKMDQNPVELCFDADGRIGPMDQTDSAGVSNRK